MRILFLIKSIYFHLFSFIFHLSASIVINTYKNVLVDVLRSTRGLLTLIEIGGISPHIDAVLFLQPIIFYFMKHQSWTWV